MKLIVFLFGLVGICSAALGQSKLDINRLYTLPWIIGSAPQGFVWSEDSRFVAFLWNDEGKPFRDVWIASRGNAKPLRVTSMPRPVLADSGNDLDKMQQAADAEMDSGISKVVWSPDQNGCCFC